MPSWLEDNVGLGDLLLGEHGGARPEIAALQTEVEGQVLQPGMVDEVKRATDIDAQKPFLVFSFHLYRHTGSFDDEGLADQDKEAIPNVPGFDADALVFVGQQIAGFTPLQPMAAVSEQRTWALLFAGLAGLAAARRGRPVQPVAADGG